MAEDWFINAVGDVTRAAEKARVTLGAAHEVLEPARLERDAGVPLIRIAESLVLRGGEARRAAATAYAEYEQALHALRAQVIRALVDEEGLSVTDLAPAHGPLTTGRGSALRGGAAARSW